MPGLQGILNHQLGIELDSSFVNTYENLYLSPLRSFFEKTFCRLE